MSWSCHVVIFKLSCRELFLTNWKNDCLNPSWILGFSSVLGLGREEKVVSRIVGSTRARNLKFSPVVHLDIRWRSAKFQDYYQSGQYFVRRTVNVNYSISWYLRIYKCYWLQVSSLGNEMIDTILALITWLACILQTVL